MLRKIVLFLTLAVFVSMVVSRPEASGKFLDILKLLEMCLNSIFSFFQLSLSCKRRQSTQNDGIVHDKSILVGTSYLKA